MVRTLEQSTMRKVYLRLLPFAILTYFFCYLDRINVGFAALTMNKDLGLDASMFGMAAGAFFWGYCLFEVPSNMIMEKVGARIWIARIMITWGILSGATALCTGPWSFMTVRFLLGLAEAGFFPGIVLFFTYWFPDHHRARIVSGFMLALPIAVALGAPLSTGLMELNGLWGLAGWKWMYLVEAIPTVLIGIVVLFYVTDRPAQAKWLDPDERAWLTSSIESERRRVETFHGITVLRSFWNPKVLLLALNYFGIVTASLGMLIFLPQIIKQLGFSNMQVGWVTMIPYLCASVARRHDHRGDRVLRQQGTVLGDAADVRDRHDGGRDHRLDQLARQSGRLLRPIDRRLGAGADRQLRRRALCAGRFRAHGGDRRGAVAAHPAPRGRVGGRTRAGGIANRSPPAPAPALAAPSAAGASATAAGWSAR